MLRQPVLSVLPALGALAGVCEWNALVQGHLNSRLLRKEAKTLTAAAFLDRLAPGAERDAAERAFYRLELAWRLAWPHVDRYECLEIPQLYRRVELSRNSPMTF